MVVPFSLPPYPQSETPPPCSHCGKILEGGIHGWIQTLEGGHIVCPGDFIITGIKGEHYPCKSDIFESTYTKLEEGTSHCAMRDQRLSMDELAHLEKVPELWSDKRSKTPGTDYVGHDYLRFYDREWSKWRDEPIRLLEIGLNVGASVKLWQQYFSQAIIHGIDINEFKPKVEIPDPARFVFHHGSAFDPYFLQRFLESEPKQFDIIIDDGSHFSGPIAMAFTYLWPHVKPGGYYVIEDLGEVRNPESHSPGYPNQVQFAQELLGKIILGDDDVDEAFVSKELVMLRKKT